MSAHGVVIALLLTLGVGVVAVAAAGVATAGSVYDRIHMLGPVGMLAPPLVAAALVVKEGLSPLGIKAMLVVLVLWVESPILAHATARAAVIRERGGWGGEHRPEKGTRR